MNEESAAPLLRTVEEACGMLGGISRTTFYELVKEGRVQVVKIGRRSFVTQAALEGFVANLGAPDAPSHSLLGFSEQGAVRAGHVRWRCSCGDMGTPCTPATSRSSFRQHVTRRKVVGPK